jgi:type I restriction enzyme, S subunit
MKSNWQTKMLGEICDFEGGSQPPKSNFTYTPRKGYVRFLQIRDFGSDKYITYIPESKKNRLCNEDDILLGRYGASVGKILINKKGAYNVAVMKTIPNPDVLNKKYLYYYLISDKFQRRLSKVASRSAQAGFSKDDINSFPILTPPPSEQHRIVKILDEVFEKTAKAKNNTEKNLQNASEFFKSYLQSVDAEKESLGKLVDITTGKLDANAAVEDGQYRFFTCSKEIFAIDKFAFDCEAILLAGNNAVGDFNVKHYNGKFNAYQRTYVITVNKENRILYRYLYFQLLNSLKEFKSKSVGTGTKFLKIGMIKDLQIPLPSVAKQKSIVVKLDTLSNETKELDAIYQQKLSNLDELNKSVLQKALNREL